ncbi:hypothetical protein BUALT_Bualt03G0130400 [Buddleja alternifolia]|uniref:Uncharacterized protein n=1 Tax=Buddleja alternifolia TaxID=168488 RepID=A0AAV6Y466_9LAMI|nr:hypothetical protein BUALT_Bualt03G0130400 [Buddleja alternifolia]
MSSSGTRENVFKPIIEGACMSPSRVSRRAGGVDQEGPTLGAHCGQEVRHELVHCPADCRKFGAIPLGECLGTKCSTVRRSNVYSKKLVGKMRDGSSSRLGMEVGWRFRLEEGIVISIEDLLRVECKIMCKIFRWHPFGITVIVTVREWASVLRYGSESSVIGSYSLGEVYYPDYGLASVFEVNAVALRRMCVSDTRRGPLGCDVVSEFQLVVRAGYRAIVRGHAEESGGRVVPRLQNSNHVAESRESGARVELWVHGAPLRCRVARLASHPWGCKEWTLRPLYVGESHRCAELWAKQDAWRVEKLRCCVESRSYRSSFVVELCGAKGSFVRVVGRGPEFPSNEIGKSCAGSCEDPLRCELPRSATSPSGGGCYEACALPYRQRTSWLTRAESGRAEECSCTDFDQVGTVQCWLERALRTVLAKFAEMGREARFRNVVLSRRQSFAGSRLDFAEFVQEAQWTSTDRVGENVTHGLVGLGDVWSGQASGALTACASGTKRVASRGSYLSRIEKLFIWDVPHDVKMLSTKFENIWSPFGYRDQGWTVGCHPCARKRIGRRAEGRKLEDCENCYYGMFPYVFGTVVISADCMGNISTMRYRLGLKVEYVDVEVESFDSVQEDCDLDVG